MPQPPDRHGVVAHVEDPRQYVRTDRGTQIPRADADGNSLGIRRGGPAPVCIDPTGTVPDASDIRLDLHSIPKEQYEQAFQLANQQTINAEDRAVLTYKILAQWNSGIKAATDFTPLPPPPRENSIMPSAYVVPSADALAFNQGNGMAVPRRARVQAAPLPGTAQPAAMSEPADFMPFPASQPADNGSAMFLLQLQQMQQQMQQQQAWMQQCFQNFDQRLTALQTPQVNSQPVARAEPPQAVPTPAVKQEPLEKVADKPQTFTGKEVKEIFAKALQGFSIPHLSDVADRPQTQITFNLGPLGRQTAWYHWVLDHNDGLYLIYDTRFEYGQRYEPPETGEGAPIGVSVDTEDQGDVTYQCHSLGLSFPFGCFYITCLIKEAGVAPMAPPAPRSRGSLIGQLTGEDT